MKLNKWINDNYYTENPDHVLGDPQEKTNAFGGTYTHYKGDAKAALAIIRSNNPSYTLLSDVPNESKKNRIKSPIEQEKNLDQVLEVSKEGMKNIEEGIDSTLNQDLDLISFDEVDDLYNKHLSKEEKQVFVWYMRSLGRSMQGGWIKYQVPMRGGTGEPNELKGWVNQGLVCYDGKKHLPRFIFESGNLYQTIDALKLNKAKIIKQYSETVYEQQLQYLEGSLQRLQEKSLRLDAQDPSKRLRILVTDAIAQSYEIRSLKDGIAFKGRVSGRKDSLGEMDFKIEGNSWDQEEFEKLDLKTAFLWWLRGNTDTAAVRFGLTWQDIMDLAINQKKRGKDEDPKKFRTDKKNAKIEAERLFSRFLAEEILEEDRKKIEKAWNKKYNGIIPVDYNKVPIGFAMARYYRGMEMDIRPEKREAIAASMMQGSLCIAYGVGLGKTWCTIFCMAQFLENGWAKRPLLSVPLQVYPQFVKEIKGILPHLRVNELGNLSEKHLSKVQDPEGNSKQLPIRSISVITYHGFKQIGFSDNVARSLLSEINSILNQGDRDLQKKKTKRQQASEKEKAKGVLGQALKGTKVDIDALGIDFIAIDEAHAAKKIFTSVKAETSKEGKKGRAEYLINSGVPSAMGIKTFALAQYVQHINPTGNILLLSATPFTNSPLEVYSMLSIMAYKELKSVGLNSIKNFFDKFVLVKDQLVIDTSLRPVHKEVFTGFANLVGLQGFIRKYFLYKQKTKGLKRPNKFVLPYKPNSKEEGVSSIIPLSIEQSEIMTFITSFAQGDEDLPWDKIVYTPYKKSTTKRVGPALDDDDSGARVLLSVSLARALALSPYLFPYQVDDVDLPILTYKTYIETSSKLQYTMNCIKSVKEAHEKKGEPVSGQIVYMNLGVQYFPLIKEYLVKEIGYKEHEVGIIQGTMPAHEGKGDVQDLFLGRRFNPATQEYENLPDKWRVKVLLGSNSITEGINLQTHCTVIYNLFLPWNPTDTVQLEGRGWRQGNQYMNIRIVYPLLEDSMDIFMFQKLGEKTTRINEVWNFDGNASLLDLSEFDPSELKYQIIKDPYRLAAIEAEEDKEVYKEEIDIIQNEISLIEGLQSDTKSIANFIEDLEKAILKNGSKEEANIAKAKAKIKELQQLPLLEQAKGLKTLFQRRYKEQDKIYQERRKVKGQAYWYYSEYKAEKPWGYDNFLKNLKRYNHSVSKILKPRGIKQDEASIKAFIEKRNEDKKVKEDKLKDLDSQEYLANRARKIQAEKDKRGVLSSSVEQRSEEFAKLNTLLHEKRVDTILRPITNLPSHAFKKGQTVDVNWSGRNRKGKVLELVNHHEVPMYRVQYRFGDSYKQVVLETEITTKIKTPKKKVTKSKTKAISKPKQINNSNKSKKDIEVFAFALQLKIKVNQNKLALLKARKQVA